MKRNIKRHWPSETFSPVYVSTMFRFIIHVLGKKKQSILSML